MLTLLLGLTVAAGASDVGDVMLVAEANWGLLLRPGVPVFLRMEGLGWAILIGECGLGGSEYVWFECPDAELPVLGRPDWSLEVDELVDDGPEF